jgi:exodeoxyribonuclease V gamma subunit
MNDGEFPRRDQRPGFDLIGVEPRAGDRSRRDDDRYLFLESILSARQQLIITYTGQSRRDNTPIPPAIPVTELLDSLDASVASDLPVRKSIVLVHPLQPFSRRAFAASDDERRGSYAAEFFAGAHALSVPRLEPQPFFTAPLAALPSTDVIDLDRFAKFFDNPPRMFLRQRLGLYLDGTADSINDREPIELSNLEKWKIGDYLLPLSDDGALRAQQILRARGDLPPGSIGTALFEDIAAEARALTTAARQFGERRTNPLPIRMTVGGLSIVGALRDLREGAQLCLSYSKLRAKAQLAAWIKHLVLLNMQESGLPNRSVVIGRAIDGDGIAAWQFGDVDDPRQHLENLLLIFKAGERLPLPLPLDIALKFVEDTQPVGAAAPSKGKRTKTAKTMDEAAAIEKAREKYGPKRASVYSASDDLYFQLAFRGGDLFATGGMATTPELQPYADFRALARSVFMPLLQHRRSFE